MPVPCRESSTSHLTTKGSPHYSAKRAGKVGVHRIVEGTPPDNSSRVCKTPQLDLCPIREGLVESTGLSARRLIAGLVTLVFMLITGARGAETAVSPVPVARTVLCLYGFEAGDPTRTPVWPPDTYSAQILQMALEWMGYEMEFHHVGSGRPPETLDSRFAMIILDSGVDIPFADQDYYRHWLVKQKDRGVKLLFIGGYPGDKDRQAALAGDLGIQGTLEDLTGVKSATFSVLDKAMIDEALLVKTRSRGLISARAPAGSQAWLSVAVVDKRDLSLSEDVIYTAPWGGAIMEPYLYFRTSVEDLRSLADPFTFLATMLPAGAFPVPDKTTRDGVRMFLTHIDGDGFTTLSRRLVNVTCAEIIRDEFVKKYPFPVTVSVIESELKALLKDQQPQDRQRFEDIARSLFALPNVQVASHAWSHPFVWMPDIDVEGSRLYPTKWLEFANPATYPAFDLRREIEGSVKYINETLTTKNKPVEVYLWSGNCRPSGEALKMVAALGLEAMNGGNTIINRRAEGIGDITSADTFMDGELQVYAPVQNEYTYTNGFTGPLYGGYRVVLDTFQRTEKPRRLKPVNVYYHFYSVQNRDSEKALSDVHEWCVKQVLHSVTARDFVRLAKDARATQVLADGPHRWIVQNKGFCRTFRLPKSMGVPDLSRCQSVTGYKVEGDQVYVHTSGESQAVLDFRPAIKGGISPPWLESSTGEIELAHVGVEKISGHVKDLRPNAVAFAGLTPGLKFSVSGEPSLSLETITAQVNDSGVLQLLLPAECSFSLIPVPN